MMVQADRCDGQRLESTQKVSCQGNSFDLKPESADLDPKHTHFCAPREWSTYPTLDYGNRRETRNSREEQGPTEVNVGAVVSARK